MSTLDAPDAPDVLAREAAAVIATTTGVKAHDVAVVLGSGWGKAADLIGGPEAEVALSDVPGFAAPAVAGHTGTLRSVLRGDNRCLVFLGRTHLYEGRGVDAVAHSVRTAAAAGCTRVVLTNGCGGLDPDWAPGTVVLIRDHLNLTATSPLRGADFVDLTDLYSPRLRAVDGKPGAARAQIAPGKHVCRPVPPVSRFSGALMKFVPVCRDDECVLRVSVPGERDQAHWSGCGRISALLRRAASRRPGAAQWTVGRAALESRSATPCE